MYQAETVRIVYTFAMFYFPRSIVQNLFTFKFITFANWEWPGFPSLMVPYGKNSDFYISGHTGFFVVMIGEMHLIGMPLFFKACAGCFLMYEIMILLIYRQHYSIDIISGLLYAVWVSMQSQKVAVPLDKMFARLRVWYVNRYLRKEPELHDKHTKTQEHGGQRVRESRIICYISGGVEKVNST